MEYSYKNYDSRTAPRPEVAWGWSAYERKENYLGPGAARNAACVPFWRAASHILAEREIEFKCI